MRFAPAPMMSARLSALRRLRCCRWKSLNARNVSVSDARARRSRRITEAAIRSRPRQSRNRPLLPSIKLHIEGVVAGADFFVGPGQANQTVYGVSGSAGIGAGTGPVEVHGGPTYTVAGTFIGPGCPANSK
jgi:hypothetical protein